MHGSNANRPGGVDRGDVQVAVLPFTRREPRNRYDARLEVFLNMNDDPLLGPLRVVVLARARDGKLDRRDLLTFGDPRDPDPVRQYAIFSFEPERTRIVSGSGYSAGAAVSRGTP